jgi:IS30 family transposase
MEQKNYARKKKHLTVVERAKIELLLKQKKSITEIARELGRCKSVISREINRNSVEQLDYELRKCRRYFADSAQRQYGERRAETGCKYKLGKVLPLIKYIERKIKNDKWSPDAAIGRAKLENPGWLTISTKTYYNYVDLGLVDVKPLDLLLKIRRKPKKARIVKRKKQLGRSISERPEAVNSRLYVGDWEIDTVIGKRDKSGVLLTLTERKSCFEIIRKVDERTAQSVKQAFVLIKTQFAQNFNEMFKSLTSDNRYRKIPAARYLRRFREAKILRQRVCRQRGHRKRIGYTYLLCSSLQQLGAWYKRKP